MDGMTLKPTALAAAALASIATDTRALKPGRIALGAASLDLSYSGIVPAADRDRVLEISNLFTLRQERGNNHAHSLMQDVCEQADQANKLLLLMPEAFDQGGPTTAHLVDWYTRRFGFTTLQSTPKVILIRLPRTAAQQWAAAHEHE
ncbi:MAG: hypothetical protein ACJ8LG_23995 [Massilia sp.]